MCLALRHFENPMIFLLEINLSHRCTNIINIHADIEVQGDRQAKTKTNNRQIIITLPNIVTIVGPSIPKAVPTHITDCGQYKMDTMYKIQ